jgi:hypothetical protein
MNKRSGTSGVSANVVFCAILGELYFECSIRVSGNGVTLGSTGGSTNNLGNRGERGTGLRNCEERGIFPEFPMLGGLFSGGGTLFPRLRAMFPMFPSSTGLFPSIPGGKRAAPKFAEDSSFMLQVLEYTYLKSFVREGNSFLHFRHAGPRFPEDIPMTCPRRSSIRSAPAPDHTLREVGTIIMPGPTESTAILEIWRIVGSCWVRTTVGSSLFLSETRCQNQS